MYQRPEGYVYYDPVTNQYNDKPSGPFNIKMGKESSLYDIIRRSYLQCNNDERIIPYDTNAWKIVKQFHGKSDSFGSGGFNNFSMAFAMGIGYDQGFIPADVSLSDSYDHFYSIALTKMQSQSDWSRGNEGIDYTKIWEDAAPERNAFNGWIGVINIAMQGAKGYEAIISRDYTVTIQEHNNIPGFYRAFIETNMGWMNVQNNNVYVFSDFLSFENGIWKETNFNIANNRH